MRKPNIITITKTLFGALLVVLFGLPFLTQAVTVGPAKIEYTIDPGTSISGELYLKNEESETKTFYPSFEKFTEQNGLKQFIKEDSLLSTWIKTEQSVTLKPGEDRRFPYKLEVPKDAPPGGHFAIIWWSTTPPGQEGGSQVSIQTRAGILVYVNVRGNVKESAKISDFKAANGKRFLAEPKTSFSLTITNDGNTYIKPQGDIVVSSIFGRVRGQIPVNEKGLQILPGSYRILSDKTWEGSGFFIGPYRVTANVIYGENNAKQVTQSMLIWIIPWKLLLIVIGGLIVAYFGIRKYNQWLIKKARASFNQ